MTFSRPQVIQLFPEGQAGEIKHRCEWKLLGDTDGAEGAACSQLPPSIRPVTPFEGVFKGVGS
jgi:hypothetical protein